MLKFVFNFRTRGVWFLFVAGPTDQIVTWLFACYIYASEEMECGGLMVIIRYVKIYQSWWFSYRLAFGFGTHTCRLALDFWNLQHWILEFATSICNWRGGGTRGLAVYFALNFCSFSLFHSVCLVCDQKIVL